MSHEPSSNIQDGVSVQVNRSRARHVLRSLLTSPSAFIGATLLLILVFAAIFANVIAPHDPAAQHLTMRLSPPGTTAPDGDSFLLGTDALGRDILSGIIFGARVSLSIATVAVLFGLIIGTALGIIAGYLGSFVDVLIMRAVDVTIVLPFLVLALVLRVVLGPGLPSMVLALGLAGWAHYARLVRGEVLSLRNREFVLASRAAGAGRAHIMLHRIAPHVLASAVVLGSLQVGVVIVAEASLTFLGLGIPTDIPAWGSMLATGREYIVSAWWVAAFPGVAIVLTVLAVNLLGDWLRDFRDPLMNHDV